VYRAFDEHCQVIDILLRDHRDTASAEAFFEEALGRSDRAPSVIITEHHRPYIKAIQQTVPARSEWTPPGGRRDNQTDRAEPLCRYAIDCARRAG